MFVPGLPRPMPKIAPVSTSRLRRLTPIFFSIERLISATRTFSITCSGVATFNRLTGRMSRTSVSFLPGFSSEVTSDWACAASCGEATVPFMTASCPTVVTVMLESGMAA